jgi:hypothetical protein
MRHILTVEQMENGRLRALEPEARRKRRETWRRYREEDKDAVRVLRKRGLVPLAIGPALGMPDSTVARYLRDLEGEGEIESVPSFLNLMQ